MRRVWLVVAGVLGIGSIATAYVITHADHDATIVANVAIISVAILVGFVALCQVMSGD